MTDIPNARITRYDVFIGDDKLPGLILDGGVTADFGGASATNILTVKFIVGHIFVEDPTLLETDDDEYPIGEVRG